MSQDLMKNDLYEGVKLLVESTEPHLHLNQAKLFTLFSLSFQYLLFLSTKTPGAYIIRIEDGQLAEKLAKKAKDPSTRKFMTTLLLSRKLKVDKSVFYVDYFHSASWNITGDIPQEKVKAALIVKAPVQGPMVMDSESSEIDLLAEKLYLKTLQSFVPKTITIAFEEIVENSQPLEFPFIKKEKEKVSAGVKIHDDSINWD